VTVRASDAILLVWPVAAPVTVMVEVPVVAPLPTVRVRVEVVPVGAAGSNAAVTPVGRPDAERVTAPANPPFRVMVIALVPVLPASIVRVPGLRAKSNEGASATVTLPLAVASVTPLPLARTVKLPVAAVAVPDAVRVSVEEVSAAERPGTALAEERVPGLKLAVTPAGRPSALSVTEPVYPPPRVIVTVVVPVPPWTRETLPPMLTLMVGVGVGVVPPSPPQEAARRARPRTGSLRRMLTSGCLGG
jgi:hypothetical protein